MKNSTVLSETTIYKYRKPTSTPSAPNLTQMVDITVLYKHIPVVLNSTMRLFASQCRLCHPDKYNARSVTLVKKIRLSLATNPWSFSRVIGQISCSNNQNRFKMKKSMYKTSTWKPVIRVCCSTGELGNKGNIDNPQCS